MALAGCGSSGPQGKPTARSPDDGRGTYKVGRPYNIAGTTYYPAENWTYSETGIASWYGPGFHGRPTASGEIFDQNAISAAHPTLPLPSIVRVTNLDNGRVIVVRVNDRGPFTQNRIIDLSKGAAQEIGLVIAGTAKVRVDLLREQSQLVKQIAMQGGGRDQQMAAVFGSGGEHVSVASASAPAPTSPAVESAVLVQPLPAPDPVRVAAHQPQPLTPAPSPAATPPAVPAGYAGGWQTASAASSYGNAIYVQAGAFSVAENAERLRAQLATMGDAHIMQISVSGNDFYRVRIGPMASIEAADNVLARVAAAGHGDARIVSD